jgi:aminoglycoside phosphotransferase (APT) family kinase protein
VHGRGSVVIAQANARRYLLTDEAAQTAGTREAVMAGIDRQTAFSGTRDVADALRFDETRLATWLGDMMPGFAGPLTVRQFKGGQSNPTYLLETPAASYVLRRKPPGKLLPSAHAVDREYRVLAALHAQGFPVAEPIILCSDDSIVGTMFYVMRFVSGRVFWTPDMQGSNPVERRVVYDAMNATLSTLHGYDPAVIGLADFGKGENYVGRQVERWTKQYRASEIETVAEMDRLIEWLPANLPPAQPPRLVHGDYRLDNMILHASEPRVLAVLDWELATLGDPLADFTYHLMAWHNPPSQTGAGTGTLVGTDLAALGIPDADTYVDAYARRTGLDPRPHLDIYMAYNFFRLTAILQGILGRVRDGTASNAKAVEMVAPMLRPLAETAFAFARKAGA